jgi:hypothetical protein
LRDRNWFAGLALLAAPAQAEPVPAESTATSSPFYSAEDGMFDVSTFMEGRHGFLSDPVPDHRALRSATAGE